MLDKKEAFSLHNEVGDCGEKCEIDFTLEDDKPFMIRPYVVSPQKEKPPNKGHPTQ